MPTDSTLTCSDCGNTAGRHRDEGVSTTRCRQCRKPIVWPGLCYTCATGLPRQLRPRKDTPDDSPPQQVATSDEPGAHG